MLFCQKRQSFHGASFGESWFGAVFYGMREGLSDLSRTQAMCICVCAGTLQQSMIHSFIKDLHVELLSC